MDTTQWIVSGAGLALILGIAVFFFTSSKGVAMSATTANGIQTQHIVVKGGYNPSKIIVHAGEPVRLVFERHETSPCSEELLIPAFGIKRDLAPHAKTTVEFTPTKPGTYEFTCGMNMLRGSITVEASHQ